jgi:hypothetical protein
MTSILMLGGYPVEAERRMYSDSTDPAKLRQRMIERGEPETGTGDFDLLSALHEMDNDNLRAALQLLPDAECKRMADLIPIWQALAAAPEDEIEQLYDEMNE